MLGCMVVQIPSYTVDPNLTQNPGPKRVIQIRNDALEGLGRLQQLREKTGESIGMRQLIRESCVVQRFHIQPLMRRRQCRQA